MKLKPANFAREAGVSRQAIFTKIKNNTLIVDSAGYLDTDNPINSAYISDPDRSRRRAVAATPAVIVPPAGQAAPGPPMLKSDMDIAAAGIAVEMLSLTIRELVIGYGGSKA